MLTLLTVCPVILLDTQQSDGDSDGVCLHLGASLCCNKRCPYQHRRLIFQKLNLEMWTEAKYLWSSIIFVFFSSVAMHINLAITVNKNPYELTLDKMDWQRHQNGQPSVGPILQSSHISALTVSCRCVTGSTPSWPRTLRCCSVTTACLCSRTWWLQHRAITSGWCCPLSCLPQTERSSGICCPRWLISGSRSVPPQEIQAHVPALL